MLLGGSRRSYRRGLGVSVCSLPLPLWLCFRAGVRGEQLFSSMSSCRATSALEAANHEMKLQIHESTSASSPLSCGVWHFVPVSGTLVNTAGVNDDTGTQAEGGCTSFHPSTQPREPHSPSPVCKQDAARHLHASHLHAGKGVALCVWSLSFLPSQGPPPPQSSLGAGQISLSTAHTTSPLESCPATPDCFGLTIAVF